MFYGFDPIKCITSFFHHPFGRIFLLVHILPFAFMASRSKSKLGVDPCQAYNNMGVIFKEQENLEKAMEGFRRKNGGLVNGGGKKTQLRGSVLEYDYSWYFCCHICCWLVMIESFR